MSAIFSPAARRGLSADLVQQRIGGALGPDELAAAQKAAAHANTPAIAHFDGLGRTFLTIADNGKDASGAEQLYSTRTVLDIVGNQRAVIDALGRVVMRYDYDMLKHNPSGEHGGGRALDAQRRRGQADPRLEQPQLCFPHGI